MQKVLKYIYIFLITFFILSCGEEEIDPTDSSATAFGIRHDNSLSDYEDMATETGDLPDFNSVICFSYSLNGSSNEDFVASGTLIKENWILTAGHNFFVAEDQTTPALPSGISVLTGNDPNNPSNTYEVEEIIFHPTWIQDNEDFINGNDLCLVKLKSSITNITPMPLYTDDTETIGNQVWFCGFGDYSQTEGQDPDLFSKKHAIENILDRKIDGITTTIDGTTYNGGLLAFDFDHPDGSINTLGDDISNSDENILGSGSSSSTALEFEGATVQGDSGGPLFIKDGDTWKLGGVLSGGASDPVSDHEDSDYGDISVFIRVSTHITWINNTIK